MLRAHMPELVPAYERVVELAGGGDLAARMLSLYKPPPYLAACSQGAWTRDGVPMLVRNYDYAPSRMEGVIWSTRLLDRRVLGMSDCLWGLLDGMNDAGLAVSLTFGGRRALGDGFGIPLVVRYLLEVCETVAEARETLARLAVQPVPQPHDRRSRPVTCSPPTSRPTASRSSGRSRPPRTTRASWSGRSRRERPARSNASSSIVRLLEEPDLTAEGFCDAFMQAPLFSTSYASGFGTLYTAAYRAAEGVVDYRWPSFVWRLGFEAFTEEEHTEVLAEGSVA